MPGFMSNIIGYQLPGVDTPGDRGVFGGGYPNPNTNVIDYITISTPGNATDFGDLSQARSSFSATSNGTNSRGVFGGGIDNSPIQVNTIDYICINILANALDFGDLVESRSENGATSNDTNERGVWAGDNDLNFPDNAIDYITISTKGHAADFGDLAYKKKGTPAACSNGTNNRGVFGGGVDEGGVSNVLDYITISSLGNGADFGDLTVARYNLASTSNRTNNRGVWAGGNTYLNTIDYVTINSAGDATDFGDLTVARNGLAGTSNGTNETGIFGGGSTGSVSNVIDYITINSTGNATDFGDLTVARTASASTSNA